MRTLVLALALCATSASSAHAQQPDYDAAKRHFLNGKDLFEKHEFLKAATEFEAAYEITKDPVVLFNVGEAWERAGKAEEAIRAYEGYLAGTPQAQDREDVERRITELKNRRNQPPPPPPPVNAPPQNPPPGAMENPVVPSTPGGEGSSKLRVAAWVGVGLTAAFLTTAGMLALSAQSKQDDIERMQTFVDAMGRPLEWNTGDNKKNFLALYDDGNTFKDLSIAFFVISGVTAAGTATLFLLDHYQYSARAEAVPNVRVGAVATPQGAEVSVGWSF